MSDSSRPGSEELPDSVPAPPQPPFPPAPPVPPVPPAPRDRPSTPVPSYGTPSAEHAPRHAPTAPYASAAPYPPAPPFAAVPAAPPRTLSLLGMVLGIVGLLISLFLWGFGFVLSAPAVVLGFLGRRREPGARGFALAAIITGFAGIAVSLVYLAITIVLVIVALSAAGSAVGP